MTAYPQDADPLPTNIGERLPRKDEQPIRDSPAEHLGNGVWRLPDGKLETRIPVPGEPPRLPKELAAYAIAHGLMQRGSDALAPPGEAVRCLGEWTIKVSE